MAQTKTMISTTQAPRAIGPYSQAVARRRYCSSPPARSRSTPPPERWSAEAFASRPSACCDNLAAVLEEADLDMANVVKTTVYLKNMSDFTAMNEVYARYFAPEGVVPPARSTVEVARLPKDALLEIEVIATQP